jgi:signal transduction histidine kinase
MELLVALASALGVAGLLAAIQGYIYRRYNRAMIDFQLSTEANRHKEQERFVGAVADLAREALRTSKEPALNVKQEPPRSATTLTDSAIIAELAHSLRTPLNAARHEAAAISLSYPDNESLKAQAASISNFIDLSDTVLATFRQLVDTAKRTERLRSGPLRRVIRQVHAVAESQCNRHTRLDLDESIPDSLPGYTTGYIATLLLPLVENAVEASPNGEAIRVELSESPDYYFLILRNQIEGSQGDTEFPSNGDSTKHDGPGLGLPVARRLADMRRGGRVESEVMGVTARVRVRLPKGESRP